MLQTDGNLVIYDGAPGQNPIWATGTWNLPNERRAYLEMQDDGNLVIYHSGRAPIWASGTRR